MGLSDIGNIKNGQVVKVTNIEALRQNKHQLVHNALYFTDEESRLFFYDKTFDHLFEIGKNDNYVLGTAQSTNAYYSKPYKIASSPFPAGSESVTLVLNNNLNRVYELDTEETRIVNLTLPLPKEFIGNPTNRYTLQTIITSTRTVSRPITSRFEIRLLDALYDEKLFIPGASYTATYNVGAIISRGITTLPLQASVKRLYDYINIKVFLTSTVPGEEILKEVKITSNGVYE